MNKLEQEVFGKMIMELRSLFHRMAAVADELHKEIDLPTSQRAILESLSRLGPKTVPQLANMRPVSRQHIQIIVNQLLDKKLVELVANPAHRRSSLVQLTKNGATTYKQLKHREAELLSKIDLPVSATDLETTVQTMGTIKEFFANDQWRNHKEADSVSNQGDVV